MDSASAVARAPVDAMREEAPLDIAGGSPLDALADRFAADIDAVNRVVVEKLQSPVALIPELATYLVAAGGKRLRPLLTVAAADLLGYRGDRHHALAACVEFIHTATLLHDDVVDDSAQRRGKASANAVYGNKASVLVGDFLFSRSFELMVADGDLDVLAILSSASSVIAEGEVMQLMTSNDTETSIDAYLAVIESKTAALFAAACEVGAVVADAPAEQRAAARRYGGDLGMAFQIVDDVLDFSADRARLGKTIGDDFREGKLTLPIVLAYARGDEADRAFWRRTLEDLDQGKGDLERAMRLMVETDAFADSLGRARRYATSAREALAHLPAGAVRDQLSDVVDFVVERQY